MIFAFSCYTLWKKSYGKLRDKLNIRFLYVHLRRMRKKGVGPSFALNFPRLIEQVCNKSIDTVEVKLVPPNEIRMHVRQNIIHYLYDRMKF